MKPAAPKKEAVKDPHALAARRLSQTVLDDVFEKKKPLDAALEDRLKKAAGSDMSGRDRAFARAIATTTIRRMGQIDDVIRRFTKQGKLPSRSRAALSILRAAVAELVFLEVPPHAAIDSANRLTSRHTVAKHFRPLINAVLRQVSEHKADALAAQDPYLLNIPAWLRTRWETHYGASEARAIGEACLKPPPLDLTLKGGPNAASEWEARLKARPLENGSLRLTQAGQVEQLPGFTDGTWWAQDAAATFPARLFGEAIHGQTVLDLCAAPGGKTAQLASLGAHVVALDRSATRLARVQQNLVRLGLSAEIVEADVLKWRPPTLAPLVLLDAPCSATGTLRRHPDILHGRTEADILDSARMQTKMLDVAASFVSAGGLLVFCTCSLEPEEGDEQITKFLETHREFGREPITPDEVFGQADFLTAEGDLRTLPRHWSDVGGLDGFFAARLRRVS